MATTEPTPGRCNANGRNGYCEKYPVKGGSRCRFHGGASTGPSDTEYLEENDFAEGNPGGGAPELNANAATAHGVWGDWRKVYERLPEEEKEYYDLVAEDLVEQVTPYTPDMDPGRREELALEHGILGLLYRRATFDVWAGVGDNPAEDARGVYITKEVEIDGETYEVDKPNPSLDRESSITARRRAIEEELNLRDAWQNKEPPGGDDEDDGTNLAEFVEERLE